MKLALRSGLFFCLFIALSIGAKAQIGGTGIYKFMNLPPSSRTASLGGTQISVKDEDVSLGIQNPALLNPQMHNHVQMSFIDYMTDIHLGSFAYARSFDSSKVTGMAGIQFINYGSFRRMDERGNDLGTFTAAEYNIFAGASKTWRRYSYGIETKLLYSTLEHYNSFGIGFDLGGAYEDTARGLMIGAVVRNIGFQIKPYADMREPLPFEVQLGASLKPEHMPIRFSILAHDLQKPNLTYENPDELKQTDLLTGEVINEKIPFSEKIARHFNFGAEILITKNFNVRVGYNHERRKEMVVEDGKRGAVGFSYGFGFKVSKFVVSYGRSNYHIAGGSNTFTLSSNLSEVFRKKAARTVTE
jgi:hypothetical protein